MNAARDLGHNDMKCIYYCNGNKKLFEKTLAQHRKIRQIVRQT